jgi:hypothetical protein
MTAARAAPLITEGSARTVVVTYGERRASGDGAPAALKSVAVSLGARSAPLKVVSSDAAAQSRDVSTQARGSVPLSLIQRFSALSGRALVISTVDARDARTAIRVGNSGIGPAFAQLQQHCGSRARHATNARNRQGGGR